MKNTERLDEPTLEDLRTNNTDEEINKMTPTEIFDNLMNYYGHGIELDDILNYLESTIPSFRKEDFENEHSIYLPSS